MMAGTVVKVGQDKTSGKYVTLQHGNCMISYCHLSKILVAREQPSGRVMRSVLPALQDAARRTPAYHLPPQWQECRSRNPLNMSGEYSRNVFRHWPNYDFFSFDCMADTVAPYRHPDDGHRRHGKRLSIENGGHHLAAVPFYFLLVVGHTLSGRQHIVNDNDFFSFISPVIS